MSARAVAWAVVVGAVVAIGVIAYLHFVDPEPVDDPQSAEHVARIDSLRAENERLGAADSVRTQEYADSVAKWEVRRQLSERSAARARAEAERVAQELRAQLDTMEARLFAEFEAEKEREIAAARDDVGRLESQVGVLTERVGADSLRIIGLRAEVAEHRALDERRLAVNAQLQTRLARAENRGKLVRWAFVGAAAKVAYDAYRDGNTELALGAGAFGLLTLKF